MLLIKTYIDAYKGTYSSTFGGTEFEVRNRGSDKKEIKKTTVA